MTTTLRTQLRGNCQRCGALQAATNGHIAQHGYTVKGGWFQGGCTGHGFPAMQDRRDTADSLVAEVRADVVKLQADLVKMEAGKIRPINAEGKLIIGGPKSGSRETIPFADADEFAQKRAVAAMIWNTKGRIKAGTQFADDLEALANRVHGTPMVQVPILAPAARAARGDKKLAENGKVLTATSQEGQRVYYTWEQTKEDGTVKKVSGWRSPAAWRKLTDAPVVAA